MPDNDSFWDFYWETRLLPLENLGKRAAILAASGLIRRQSLQAGRPLRLLELGCGEGQIIGALLDAHTQVCSAPGSVGVDYNPLSLQRCKRDFPAMRCVQGDFTDPTLLAGLGKFDLVLLVNALHEVFSDCFSPELGEVDIQQGKQKVEQALGRAAGCLAPEGWLVLFDGLEPPGDLNQPLHIRFQEAQFRQDFEVFASQYQPFRIRYRQLADPMCVELSRRDFTRYLTKSIFLGKWLWETEQRESYQYFTEAEFRAAFARQGLEIAELTTLTVDEEKWRQRVEIDSPGVSFPEEHIMILAQSPLGQS
jgi:SAM-dependent methyltransferase